MKLERVTFKMQNKKYKTIIVQKSIKYGILFILINVNIAFHVVLMSFEYNL